MNSNISKMRNREITKPMTKNEPITKSEPMTKNEPITNEIIIINNIKEEPMTKSEPKMVSITKEPKKRGRPRKRDHIGYIKKSKRVKCDNCNREFNCHFNRLNENDLLFCNKCEANRKSKNRSKERTNNLFSSIAIRKAIIGLIVAYKRYIIRFINDNNDNELFLKEVINYSNNEKHQAQKINYKPNTTEIADFTYNEEIAKSLFNSICKEMKINNEFNRFKIGTIIQDIFLKYPCFIRFEHEILRLTEDQHNDIAEECVLLKFKKYK